MGSLKHIFWRSQNAAWSIGTGAEVGSSDVYMNGAVYSNPDTLARPAVGGSLLCAKLGPGQVLGLSVGGIHPPKPPEAP